MNGYSDRSLMHSSIAVAIICARQVSKASLLKQAWPDKVFYDLEFRRMRLRMQAVFMLFESKPSSLR
jgi:hypothetical protein